MAKDTEDLACKVCKQMGLGEQRRVGSEPPRQNAVIQIRPCVLISGLGHDPGSRKLKHKRV